MKFGTIIDLLKNEIRNMVFENSATAPLAPKKGSAYFDTAKEEFGVYNGTEWVYGSTLAEATETALGGIKLAGDLKGGTGAAPQVTGLHLAGDTAINHKLTKLTTPTEGEDAANKAYVDAKSNGISWKEPAQLATFAALPAYTHTGSGATGQLEGNANGALTVDGVAVTVKMRIWVTLAVEEKHNGLYEVTQAGGVAEKYKLLRTADANSTAELENATALVREGTELAGSELTISNTGEITVDTTAIKVINFQSGLAVVGDEALTTRVGNKIELKPSTAVPALPAEGAASAVSEGAARVKRFAIKGDGATTSWTVTHNLGTKLIAVSGQENTGGEPTVPIELQWEPGTANTIVISFPEAPAKAVSYFLTVVG